MQPAGSQQARSDRETGRLKTVASVYAKASITDWLSVKTNFGLDFMYNRNVSTLHRDHPNAQQNHGYYGQTSSELFRYTWTNTINVNKDFANGHSLNAVAGMEMFQGKWYTSNFTGYDLNSDMMQSPAGIGDKSGSSLFPPSIGGGRTMSNLMSFFAQASYSIANKYNFSASLRHDTSSKFYEDNASATFWSVGASWLISSESWFDNAKWLNQLKLRASYGTTGNQDGVSDFGTFDGYYNSSYNGESGYSHGQLGNSELRWETSAQTNVGLDVSVLDSRVNVTFDFYNI
uniref:TonB-dependent receptor domain-containing protein n=1 Tax=Alistipes sp. TaxID=1872444 RepID=UPI003AAC3803